MRVKVTLTKKCGMKARMKEVMASYSNTAIIKERSNSTRNVNNVNFYSKNIQVIPSLHKILEKYNELTLWKFFYFCFVGPKSILFIRFKKM